MTHSELCFETAKHFMKTKTNKIALYEYKSFASVLEEPDVLIYTSEQSTLYEIKMSRSDFLADAKKACRQTVHQDFWVRAMRREEDKDMKKSFLQICASCPELFYKQFPHLGNKRYFVCETGLIQPEEIPEHWGLYWYKDGKFTKKKESDNFRVNMKLERDLAVHSFRRWVSGDKTGILINTY